MSATSQGAPFGAQFGGGAEERQRGLLFAAQQLQLGTDQFGRRPWKTTPGCSHRATQRSPPSGPLARRVGPLAPGTPSGPQACARSPPAGATPRAVDTLSQTRYAHQPHDRLPVGRAHKQPGRQRPAIDGRQVSHVPPHAFVGPRCPGHFRRPRASWSATQRPTGSSPPTRYQA